MNPHQVNKCNDQAKPHNLTQSSNPVTIMNNLLLHITQHLIVHILICFFLFPLINFNLRFDINFCIFFLKKDSFLFLFNYSLHLFFKFFQLTSFSLVILFVVTSNSSYIEFCVFSLIFHPQLIAFPWVEVHNTDVFSGPRLSQFCINYPQHRLWA